MKEKRIITILVIAIVIMSSVAAGFGIFSKGGPGSSTIVSVRGEKVHLYGKGVYYQMSAEVAPQGIAQDAVTLFIGVPLLLLSLFLYRRDSIQGKILMSGVLGYFLVTYMFFTMMAMYNQLFLLWVILLSLSFYGFILVFKSINENELLERYSKKFPVKVAGGFLIFMSVAIGFLWLSIVIPPTLSDSIPKEVEHYTTLVVQALDLSVLLPASFIAGVLLIQRRAFGFKLSAVYSVFLSILMTALSAKIIAMERLGYNVIPAIFIIPIFNAIAVILTIKFVLSVAELKKPKK